MRDALLRVEHSIDLHNLLERKKVLEGVTLEKNQHLLCRKKMEKETLKEMDTEQEELERDPVC